MARSRRKTPILGMTTSPSEKKDKRAANRLVRRKVRTVLLANPEVEVLPGLKELSDPWHMDKDGKRYWGSGLDPKFMRK